MTLSSSSSSPSAAGQLLLAQLRRRARRDGFAKKFLERLHDVWWRSHLRTRSDPSPSLPSERLNQISAVATCLDVSQHTHTSCRLLWNEFRDTLPPSLPRLSIGLQCVGVQQCVIGFSLAARQPGASAGLGGRKSITAGLSLACGGLYGSEIRT